MRDHLRIVVSFVVEKEANNAVTQKDINQFRK